MGTPWHGDLGSAHHPADHARPQSLRQGHVPPDGFQAASLKGRLAPWTRPLSKAAALGGQDLCPHFAVGGQAPGVALVGGWVTSLPGGPAGGHQGDSGAGGRRPREEWWVNKVGTYGMASAQSYWGRLAGSPSAQGPLRTFPSSGLELRLRR